MSHVEEMLKTVRMLGIMMKATKSNNIDWELDQKDRTDMEWDFNQKRNFTPTLDMAVQNTQTLDGPCLSIEELSYSSESVMSKELEEDSWNFPSCLSRLDFFDIENFSCDNFEMDFETSSVSSSFVLDEVIDCDDSFPVEDKPIKEDDEEEDDDDDDDDEDEREIFSSSPADSSDEDFIKRTNHKRTLLKRASNNSSISKKGRKRRKRRNLLKPGSQLYQFILKLLDDEEKQNEIAWVCREEGIFRIIQKDIVAKRWGDFKERGMTYDSLSRGLRHYYQQGLLNSVNKKLHYQFTQKALEEWEEIRDKEFIDEKRGE